MPRCVSHPIDVPLFASLAQWLLWLGDTTTECPRAGERSAGAAHAGVAYRARWRARQSADVGGIALCRGALWPPSGRPLDASGRLTGGAATATLAPEDVWYPTRGDAEPFGSGLYRHNHQHPMGHRHHLHTHRRTLALSLHRAGFAFGGGGGLVDESTTGPAPRHAGGVDGGVAATGSGAGHSAF